MPDDKEIEIRIVSEDQAEILWQIVQESFKEYMNTGAPSSALLESQGQVKDSLKKGREKAIICYLRGEPAGCARFYKENGIYFRRLAVLPKFRGMKLSRVILEWLESYAIGMGEKRIWCNTRSSVQRNMQLYTSQGYIVERNWSVQRNGIKVAIATLSKNLENP